jgi:hypothetical protein
MVGGEDQCIAFIAILGQAVLTISVGGDSNQVTNYGRA